MSYTLEKSTCSKQWCPSLYDECPCQHADDRHTNPRFTQTQNVGVARILKHCSSSRCAQRPSHSNESPLASQDPNRHNCKTHRPASVDSRAREPTSIDNSSSFVGPPWGLDCDGTPPKNKSPLPSIPLPTYPADEFRLLVERLRRL